MKKIISSLLASLVPGFVKRYLESENDKKYNYSVLSYAQEGEDMILLRFFNYRKKGFFVDVGAHHPTRFSNTYRLYVYGWRGINLDATPGSMKEFNQLRPEDINLEIAISDETAHKDFFVFDDAALNTFSEQDAENLIKNGEFKFKNKLSIQTHRLSEVLDKKLPPHTRIDLLNIDVEGHGMEVLKGADIERFKPALILIETGSLDMHHLQASDEYDYLVKRDYELFAKTYKTAFFQYKGPA